MCTMAVQRHAPRLTALIAIEYPVLVDTAEQTDAARARGKIKALAMFSGEDLSAFRCSDRAEAGGPALESSTW